MFDALSEKLQQTLTDAFNKGETDRLTSHLSPDVIVTWQDAHVSRGPAQVSDYLTTTRTDPTRIYGRITVAPTLDPITRLDDTHLTATGDLNDSFSLADHSTVNLHSRFTATLARRANGPWQLTTFQAAPNVFDNPILRGTAMKSVPLAGVGGAICGLVLGILLGILVGRRRPVPIRKPQP